MGREKMSTMDRFSAQWAEALQEEAAVSQQQAQEEAKVLLERLGHRDFADVAKRFGWDDSVLAAVTSKQPDGEFKMRSLRRSADRGVKSDVRAKLKVTGAPDEVLQDKRLVGTLAATHSRGCSCELCQRPRTRFERPAITRQVRQEIAAALV